MNSKQVCVGLLAIMMLAGVAVYSTRVIAQDAADTAVPTAPRVAVCDVALAFEQYNRAKDLGRQMETRQSEMAAEDERRVAAITRANGNLEALAVQSPEYQRAQDEYQRLVLEHQVWRQFEQARLVREHRLLTEQMYSEILRVIEEYARENGLDLVLYRDIVDLQSETTAELQLKMTQRKVLYNSSAMDITDAVIRRLNAQYASSGR